MLLRYARSRVTRSLVAKQLRCLSGSIRATDSFLVGTNGAYVEDMYHAWRADPKSVHISWQSFFKSLNVDGNASPTLPKDLLAGVLSTEALPSAATTAGQGSSSVSYDLAEDYMKILLLNRAFQIRGHYLAQLDPLGLYRSNLNMDGEAEAEYWNNFLSPRTYGFSDADLDRQFSLKSDFAASQSGLLRMIRERPMTLREIMENMKRAYCGHIGIEFMHITDAKQQAWIREKFEIHHLYEMSKNDKLVLFDRLLFADTFERFLARKHNTSKRFGLEGGETMIPGMKAAIDKAVEMGCQHVVIGMPHRGRLNVLANVLRKPMESILHEFKGGGAKFDLEGSGDVKYHLGASTHRPTYSGKTVHLSLCANPSHLEAVNPVVEGNVRAKQFYFNDTAQQECMPILLHGDAAFAGQGVVFETMELADLHNYKTGGTLHIVVNNQVGFTTDPHQSRSSVYCSDVAKAIGAPIFHVNGDDAEAVQFVCTAAAEFRQVFKKSVVVDIVCYRRHGHNETDEPAFTQPLLYGLIKNHPSALNLYRERLEKEGVFTPAEAKKKSEEVWNIFEEAFKRSADPSFSPEKETMNPHWRTISSNPNTAISKEVLESVGKAITTTPEGFNIHRTLINNLNLKKKILAGEEGVDWATGEAFAYGSLLVEGHHVRLSGQDVERGTFSHRHAVVVDQKTEAHHVFLNHIAPVQAQFMVSNSSLSEYAVLGFELGYAMENPNSLVLWEAQFGDFSNGAQIIIDQFISSMEQKWGRQSNLVMLLPHGFEGQGPEHSSARLERFLQISDDDPTVLPALKENADGSLSLVDEMEQIRVHNWVVANCSTPANYFHLLRRQVHNGRKFRKPLIVMTPKGLLRLKECRSPLSDFLPGSTFRRAIPEEDPAVTANPSGVRRLVFCTGNVYYSMLKHKLENNLSFPHVAIARVEQISPFPYDIVMSEIKRFPNAEVCWLQEEPRNMGAWTYVQPRLELALEKARGPTKIQYIGRKAAASPATGLSDQHKAELGVITEKVFA